MIVSNSNYEIDVTRSRCYTLVIPSVTKDHAGRYECQDNDGFGEKSPAEVTVIGESINTYVLLYFCYDNDFLNLLWPKEHVF